MYFRSQEAVIYFTVALRTISNANLPNITTTPVLSLLLTGIWQNWRTRLS